MTQVVSSLPDVLGRYRILGEIGRGSMGLVYQAHDPNIERDVALKVLFPQAAVQSESGLSLRERFVLEARAAGRLSHPGIATIYDADVDREQDLAFIAMEFVEGGALAAPLAGGERLGVERSCEIVGEVAEALEFAHARGVVHRDVKPANILMNREGRAVLVDFGIAKVVEVSHTLTGQILGTPAYMSPEQFRAEPIDGRSDQFSLGVVLYECLVGTRPFRGDTVAALAHEICETEPPHPADLGVAISDELWAVSCRALAKEREQRFATCGELAEALRSAGGARPEGVSSPGSGFLGNGGTRSGLQLFLDGRHLWAIGAALIVFVVLLAGWNSSRGPATATVVEPVASDAAASAGVEDGRPAQGPATLVVLHENRLKGGLMTVRIDGREVWSQQITGRGSLWSRARGNLVRATLAVGPGRHSIEVAIKGAKGKVDAVGIASTEFEAGKTRYLRVKLLPIVDQIDLDWKR